MSIGSSMNMGNDIEPGWDEVIEERCPDCNAVLVHFDLDDEDVFGCPNCRKEIWFDESMHKE